MFKKNYVCGLHYISIGQCWLETWANKLVTVVASGKGPGSLGGERHFSFLTSLWIRLICFSIMQIYYFFNSKWE